MDEYIIYNGKILPAETPVITAGNRNFRYGDGLFETIKISDNKIVLSDLHFERLFNGLNVLRFDIPQLFTRQYLQDQILTLCKKNKVENAARVRLNVFRGEGGLYDPENLHPNFIIETRPLPDISRQLNENGLIIDVYPAARKSCDTLCNLKSNNYLPYVMAALYAKQHQLNDALVLNQHNRICDATIANILWIKDEQIYTPPLSEGCVAGVMRKYLMNKIRDVGYEIHEENLHTEKLLLADEVFLTNAIQGMRWVKKFRDKVYTNTITSKLYNQLFK